MRLTPSDPTPVYQEQNGHIYCRCLICHWFWKARVKPPQKPVACPDCQSRNWSGERQ